MVGSRHVCMTDLHSIPRSIFFGGKLVENHYGCVNDRWGAANKRVHYSGHAEPHPPAGASPTAPQQKQPGREPRRVRMYLSSSPLRGSSGQPRRHPPWQALLTTQLATRAIAFPTPSTSTTESSSHFRPARVCTRSPISRRAAALLLFLLVVGLFTD